jgi:TolB-like protein/lipoprotein NlpI
VLEPADAEGLCPRCLLALVWSGDALTATAGAVPGVPDSSPALAPGERLASYRIVGLIGAGGMGEVYRAHDARLERDVAIKVVPARILAGHDGQIRLLREARLASQLNHPHICTIHDVGEADGRTYVAMELVDGQSMSALLAGGPLRLDEVLRYASQLADALAHAHGRGIIHRDLKGANIVITREGRAKILDFGLAKRLASSAQRVTESTHVSLTAPGTVAGTIAYMAPELFRGFPADARSDIWALGVVIYEMCAGRRPFQGRTDFELSSAILSMSPPALPEDIDQRLGAVISGCLEKDPAARIQRAVDVGSALEGVQTADAALPVPRQQPRRVRLAVLPLQNLSGDPTQDYFVDGMHEALITDVARLRGLRVIARSSVLGYTGANQVLAIIAEQLKVDVVLTGSVTRAGDRVRITMQLLRATDEEHLWAERYDRNMRDILAMQNEIVSAIAREIHLQLLPEEQARLRAARPVHPAAHEAYLKGSFHAAKFGPAELDTAEHYYQLALDKDPDYALPYAGIASLWLSRLVIGRIPPIVAGPRAKAAAAKAVELDDSLAEAHTMLANIRFSVDWDWPAAEAEYRRALDLNASCADAHLYFGHLLSSLGRFDEARAHMEHALELDPFNSFFRGLYGFHLLWVQRLDEAVAQFEAALQTAPHFALPRRGLFVTFSLQSRHEESLAQVIAEFESYGDQEVVLALARGRAEGGFSRALAAAADTLAARAETTYVKPFLVAMLYDHSGDVERALQWFERAFEARDHDMIYFNIAPTTRRLRATPHFRDLVRRMHLPCFD